MTPLKRHIHDTINLEQYSSIIVLGDFNLHHPLSNPPDYQKHDIKADDLIQTMATLGMDLVVPGGTITRQQGNGSGTPIDLVWGNEAAANLIVRCRIAEIKDHGSDHLPIETTLDLTPRTTV
jgi:endonuclease/exonuclease/phosphatase family metal-dependent hydrolase